MKMNMNREVLEEEARKIQEQAKLAQAGLQTMKKSMPSLLKKINLLWLILLEVIGVVGVKS